MNDGDSKLPLRWLVLILAAAFVAAAVGALTWYEHHSVPAGLLAGMATFGATLVALNQITG